MTTTTPPSRQTIACDRCHEPIAADALALGWPVTMHDGDICPSCYGDEAYCAEGHVLPANTDASDCPTCASANITSQTIADAQIEALRAEAAEHDDVRQRIICDIALDGEDSLYDADCLDEDGRPDYSGGGFFADDLREIREALRMSPDEARVECARVLAQAEAEGQE